MMNYDETFSWNWFDDDSQKEACGKEHPLENNNATVFGENIASKQTPTNNKIEQDLEKKNSHIAINQWAMHNKIRT